MTKKVLVVDDQIVTMLILQRLLENNGYSVVTTGDGEMVSGMIDTESPEILVIDIMMPKQDGLETILALRDKHPTLAIIAISSNKHYLNVAEKFGANASYEKPIHDEHFVNLINQF